jgi:hypothetical protein
MSGEARFFPLAFPSKHGYRTTIGEGCQAGSVIIGAAAQLNVLPDSNILRVFTGRAVCSDAVGQCW